MYLTDPTLYGVNLPQREIPVPTPFFPPFGAQNLPLQNFPWQQGFQRFVPPMFQYGIPPYFNQAYGMTQPFLTAPFQPMAFHPYMHLYGWQRPWMY